MGLLALPGLVGLIAVSVLLSYPPLEAEVQLLARAEGSRDSADELHTKGEAVARTHRGGIEPNEGAATARTFRAEVHRRRLRVRHFARVGAIRGAMDEYGDAVAACVESLEFQSAFVAQLRLESEPHWRHGSMQGKRSRLSTPDAIPEVLRGCFVNHLPNKLPSPRWRGSQAGEIVQEFEVISEPSPRLD